MIMILEDSNIYPHLAKFQMREQAKCEKLKTYRRNLNEFGRIEESEEGEEEQIWNLENLNRVR